MKNERRLRAAVTYLVRTSKMTREEAWVHVRTYGMKFKGVTFLSETPNAKKKRLQFTDRKARGLCIRCGKSSLRYSRCLDCRKKHAAASKETMRQLRIVRRRKAS